MSKQPRKTTPRYSRSERKAELEIDTFLKGFTPASPLSVLDELRSLA